MVGSGPGITGLTLTYGGVQLPSEWEGFSHADGAEGTQTNNSVSRLRRGTDLGGARSVPGGGAWICGGSQGSKVTGGTQGSSGRRCSSRPSASYFSAETYEYEAVSPTQQRQTQAHRCLSAFTQQYPRTHAHSHAHPHTHITRALTRIRTNAHTRTHTHLSTQ